MESPEDKKREAEKFRDEVERLLESNPIPSELSTLGTIIAIVATGLIASFIQREALSDANASLALACALGGLAMFVWGVIARYTSTSFLKVILDYVLEDIEDTSLDDLRGLKSYSWKLFRRKKLKWCILLGISGALFITAFCFILIAGFVSP